jgi:GWxTD domain-containing protein
MSIWNAIAFLIIFLLTGLYGIESLPVDREELPAFYKQWLEEEVIYIITAREREVFLQLDSNQERDLFIEAFWKQRDPTPATPQNEFKDEHFRRIKYADTMFGKGTSKPGWKTDRGKIYIILAPDSSTTGPNGDNLWTGLAMTTISGAIPMPGEIRSGTAELPCSFWSLAFPTSCGKPGTWNTTTQDEDSGLI